VKAALPISLYCTALGCGRTKAKGAFAALPAGTGLGLRNGQVCKECKENKASRDYSCIKLQGKKHGMERNARRIEQGGK
jgi:hypothetical protein